MKTYRVSFDHLNYLNLNIDKKNLMFAVGKAIGGTKAFMRYSWDNLSLNEAWVDLGASYTVVDGLNATQQPDITTWNGANLVLSPRAYDLLMPELDNYGEFLPLTINEELHYVFNCRHIVPADSAQSEADIVNDLWMGIKHIGFSMKTVSNNLLFKTRFDRCSTLYCGEAFKVLIESLKLEGLLFEEVPSIEKV